METIANAGIPVGIGVAPVIPGYNESDIPKLLERAKNAGATRAFMSMLHLDSDSIEEYFVAKMHERLSPTAVNEDHQHDEARTRRSTSASTHSKSAASGRPSNGK